MLEPTHEKLTTFNLSRQGGNNVAASWLRFAPFASRSLPRRRKDVKTWLCDRQRKRMPKASQDHSPAVMPSFFKSLPGPRLQLLLPVPGVPGPKWKTRVSSMACGVWNWPAAWAARIGSMAMSCKSNVCKLEHSFSTARIKGKRSRKARGSKICKESNGDVAIFESPPNILFKASSRGKRSFSSRDSWSVRSLRWSKKSPFTNLSWLRVDTCARLRTSRLWRKPPKAA